MGSMIECIYAAASCWRVLWTLTFDFWLSLFASCNISPNSQWLTIPANARLRLAAFLIPCKHELCPDVAAAYAQDGKSATTSDHAVAVTVWSFTHWTHIRKRAKQQKLIGMMKKIDVFHMLQGFNMGSIVQRLKVSNSCRRMKSASRRLGLVRRSPRTTQRCSEEPEDHSHQPTANTCCEVREHVAWSRQWSVSRLLDSLFTSFYHTNARADMQWWRSVLAHWEGLVCGRWNWCAKKLLWLACERARETHGNPISTVQENCLMQGGLDLIRSIHTANLIKQSSTIPTKNSGLPTDCSARRSLDFRFCTVSRDAVEMLQNLESNLALKRHEKAIESKWQVTRQW